MSLPPSPAGAPGGGRGLNFSVDSAAQLDGPRLQVRLLRPLALTQAAAHMVSALAAPGAAATTLRSLAFSEPFRCVRVWTCLTGVINGASCPPFVWPWLAPTRTRPHCSAFPMNPPHRSALYLLDAAYEEQQAGGSGGAAAAGSLLHADVRGAVYRVAVASGAPLTYNTVKLMYERVRTRREG